MIQSISKDIFDFELLEKELGLRVTNIGFECMNPECKNRFGLKVFQDQRNLRDIHPKRFLCSACQSRKELETTKEE